MTNRLQQRGWITEIHVPTATAVLALAVVLVTGVVETASAQGQTYRVLYSFNGTPDGAGPLAGLIRDSAGNLHGTTESGGPIEFQCGTVFTVDLTGKERVLYYFTGYTDGCSPEYGRLFRDAAGNLYGTASGGGIYDYGTIFKVNYSGNVKVLYTFTGTPDGKYPYAGLVRDPAGNFYSTTVAGGDASCSGGYGCGTVFKLDATGKETVLYAFAGGTDGAYPYAGVVRDVQGNLYGTTSAGGDASCNPPYGCGTVFKVDATGKETVLHTFTGGTDGEIPYAGLVRDSAGNLYGTTSYGGDPACTSFGNSGCGTVFKLDATGKETVLYAFTDGTDGALPFAGLVMDVAGNLYGTAYAGGAHTDGTVFKVGATGTETVLYSFTGERGGSGPAGGLLRDSAGNLYGTTDGGGAAALGLVFKLKP
ncbi:MAG TPA: choice-of-anchor tandem repeat GloVer-containing protein [Terriglobia bacterium]